MTDPWRGKTRARFLVLLLIGRKKCRVIASQSSARLNANEIQKPYVKHHKVSSLVKSHNTHNSVKHEVTMKMSNSSANYEELAS